MIEKDLTGEIIRVFYEVYNELGFGFLESVYEKAMIVALDQNQLSCRRQVPIKVFFQKVEIGHFFADILVENVIILELKAGPIKPEHEFQLLNYLRATNIEVGLILSFGKEPKFIRKVFSNSKKKNLRESA